MHTGAAHKSVISTCRLMCRNLKRVGSETQPINIQTSSRQSCCIKSKIQDFLQSRKSSRTPKLVTVHESPTRLPAVSVLLVDNALFHKTAAKYNICTGNHARAFAKDILSNWNTSTRLERRRTPCVVLRVMPVTLFDPTLQVEPTVSQHGDTVLPYVFFICCLQSRVRLSLFMTRLFD